MTLNQWLSVATLCGMMILFIWGRFRYDVTAIIALMAALALGLVPPEKAFTGFADDIVIIIASALVLSAAVQRTGLVERAVTLVSQWVHKPGSQLFVLTSAVGVASGLIKNIGALAMMMPAASQLARRSKTNPSRFLMPMAFASLLGGLTTMIGTSPNIIVSRVREEMTGEPFRMFDYLPTGLGMLVMGLLFLRFGYRLVPADRRAAATMGEALNISDYTTEATVSEESKAIGETIEDFTASHDNEIEVTAVLRSGLRGDVHPAMHIVEGDVLILSGDPDALERAIARSQLTLDDHEDDDEHAGARDEIGVIEGVIMAESAFVGSTAGRLMLKERMGLRLVAISRRGQILRNKPGNVVIQAGDVIVLQGVLSEMPGRLRQLGVLPLAQRQIRLGMNRSSWLALVILATAMLTTALGLVPVAVAFFAAAGAVIITGALPVNDAYEAVEWPILIMLGALIPVSETLQTTGASNILATELSHLARDMPPWGAVAMVLAASMAVTPFLNNAATVLVVAPIAAVFAKDLGYRPDAFLMATAIGAGCDFLTPIGHQCNTLVMGPGGYRFGDYARLGAPLSVLVLLLGTPLIMYCWPL
ncbi:di/tricarboxylate transporter [Novosphingobium sp. PhB57]|jgi:di/tricarboxylate transporter|uniref:SLC13 family permease n=1 Tax=unclassified Novosphingobium TaxID=2644732 RepID=UPI001045BA81|nr:SLC13 family permease [uncultured Novosphingobium sp.]TCU58760.1 di/tricarboxylate transporter [Novosphingobium sp. PhB57]TDW61765.1 di/tricarboxylate transporter [Novosphingobium sp. PhB55]